MDSGRSKRMALLEAYEELTRKETFCLGEQNMQGVLETQRKKADVLRGFERLEDEKLSPEEKDDFNRRIKALRTQEMTNAKSLDSMIASNREEFRRLDRDTKSGSKAIRAYGNPDKVENPSGKLEGQA